MKTYLRILGFARPFSRFAPSYFIFTLLSILFSLVNFSLLVPLLNVLFGVVEAEEVQKVTVLPAFDVSLDYFKNTFYYYYNQILDRPEWGKKGALQFVCLVLVVSVLLSNIFKYFAQRVMVALRAHVIRNIRQAVYERLTDLHLGFFNTQKKGDILSRMTNDVQELESTVVNTLTVVFREPVMILGYFTVLFTISTQLTVFVMLFFPITGGLVAQIVKKLKKEAIDGQVALGGMLGMIDETVSGIKVIKSFNARPYVTSNFSKLNNYYARVFTVMMNKRDMASPLSEFLGVAVVCGLLLYGGSMVLSNESALTASQFIAYIAIFSQILVPAKAISSSISGIQRGLVSGERILAILDTVPEIVDESGAVPLAEFRESIEFKNVSFAYGTTPVLKNINLTIPKGCSVALVGPSGGGKSTLADLLNRFYEPRQGSIYIDGQPLSAYTIESVRGHIGLVTQESILFNDTIYNNIAFGRSKATMADVENAARIANAHEFILRTEHGYETVIGDRGSKLSGGQRQRISIARAVLANPSILIMDEATSALDNESEKLVQEALVNLMKNRTSVVIAHRLSTIQHADIIVVLENGEIVEMGTHATLSKANGLYAKLLSIHSF